MPRGKQRVGLGLGIGVVLVLQLTACASPAPTTRSSSPAPVATPTPAFTSDAAALDRAVELFKSFSALQDQSLAGSATAENSLQQYMTASNWESDKRTTSNFLATGEHFEGQTRIGTVKAQSIDPVAGKVSFYACIDLSHTRLVDRAGKDVTPSSRNPMQNVVVTETGLPTLPIELESHAWTGASIC